MKTIIISNSRLLRRAFWALFLCMVALWAMPRNACAQIYVGQGNYEVGTYDATAGTALNPTLITGLSGVGGLVVSGNNLL